MQYRHMFALIALGAFPPFAMLVMLAITNDELSAELRENPTYHCDGSITRGFAEPGSPEASACWMEWKK